MKAAPTGSVWAVLLPAAAPAVGAAPGRVSTIFTIRSGPGDAGADGVWLGVGIGLAMTSGLFVDAATAALAAFMAAASRDEPPASAVTLACAAASLARAGFSSLWPDTMTGSCLWSATLAIAGSNARASHDSTPSRCPAGPRMAEPTSAGVGAADVVPVADGDGGTNVADAVGLWVAETDPLCDAPTDCVAVGVAPWDCVDVGVAPADCVVEAVRVAVGVFVGRGVEAGVGPGEGAMPITVLW